MQLSHYAGWTEQSRQQQCAPLEAVLWGKESKTSPTTTSLEGGHDNCLLLLIIKISQGLPPPHWLDHWVPLCQQKTFMPVSDLAELDYRSCCHILTWPPPQVNQLTGPQPGPLKCIGVLSNTLYLVLAFWGLGTGLAAYLTLSTWPSPRSICSQSRSPDKSPTGSRVLGLLGLFKSNISPF